MKPVFAAALIVALMMAVPAAAKMQVSLLAPWDGKKVPAGQECRIDGGNGKTPPMKIVGLPQGTAWILVEYNDKSYQPLSTKGGHGSIGYKVSGTSATLPAIPGMTKDLGSKAWVVKPARSTGDYASKGYLPPCSGGRGNRYSADVKAVDSAGKVLETVKIEIGRY
jgi:hypothetical protein